MTLNTTLMQMIVIIICIKKFVFVKSLHNIIQQKRPIQNDTLF